MNGNKNKNIISLFMAITIGVTFLAISYFPIKERTIKLGAIKYDNEIKK